MTKWLIEEESGQGMVEYALLLAFVALVAIALLGALGTDVRDKFDELVTIWPNI